VTRRRGRRRKKLLGDLKDRRGYCQLKEEALDHTVWRNRYGRGFGPVVWQITYDDDDDDDINCCLLRLVKTLYFQFKFSLLSVIFLLFLFRSYSGFLTYFRIVFLYEIFSLMKLHDYLDVLSLSWFFLLTFKFQKLWSVPECESEGTWQLQEF